MGNIIGSIIRLIDILPGNKTNLGAAGMVIVALLQLASVPVPYVEPIKELLIAVMAFGLAMKAARPLVK